ncbi:LysR family transcriptional regulator [Actinomadura macrotermitis]|uniref:Hydrogen peroxide-inducible genes activator n=1 Tax=Actinomadura macrotermitis TaxID=2585200 RepID=A0A7K0BX91_9ACTN|nr:LysR family transcriptional regulator [Actinomadura macrotermitis]MQY05797.1 Hydrogen peroxide-inducible genes activator [Actinomadura macrotermitis]
MRDIEIFLTLAEELHFGRTADRLLVSRARVSQAIKLQERRIGAPLFERTSRRVRLTPIGARLRDDLAAGHRLIEEGLERAASAARGRTGALALGIMGVAANEIHDIVEAFRDAHPGCELNLREAHVADPFGPLRAGAVDLQLLWLPVEEPDLTVGPVVITERLVLAVSSRHPLAGRAAASMEDLADGRVFGTGDDVPAYFEEAVIPRVTPQGRPVPRGPAAGTVQEILARVAAGQGVQPVPAHAVRYLARPDIAYVPLHDSPPLRWGLVWRTGAATPLAHAFVQIARDMRE